MLNPKQAAGGLLISQQLRSHSRLQQIGMRAPNERQAANAGGNCFPGSSASGGSSAEKHNGPAT
ncbi:hypothetical protein ACTJLF_08825 [Variovorax sp. 22077]